MGIYRSWLLVVMALGAACAEDSSEGAPPPEDPRLDVSVADSLVDAWVGEGQIPGAVLRVSRDGDPLIRRAYGSARSHDYGEGQYGAWRSPDAPVVIPLAEGRPMTPDTRFDLASVTKVMATTFAVMLLVDEGTLDLDVPVSTWLPDFRGGGKETITARHLLTHRSGLAQWQPLYYGAESPDEAYALIRDMPLEWAVDEGRHYSDLGFMLLGRIVEAVSGEPVDRFLTERLYGPLGLKATGFRPLGPGTAAEPSPSVEAFAATSHGNPFEYRMAHDATFGYTVPGDPNAWDGWRRYALIGEVNDGNAHHAFGGIAGHAGLFSDAADLEVLLRLLLEGGMHGGNRVLSESVVEEFLTPGAEGQALGWQAPVGGVAGSFGHTGFTGTFVAGVSETGLAVMLLTNRQHAGVDETTRYPDVDPLRAGVLRVLAGGAGPAR